MRISKTLATSTVALSLLVTAWAAETKVSLSGVHLCCNACVKGVEKAVAKVKGATTVIDKDGGVVVIAANDQPTSQKVVDAIVAAGYFGKSDHPSVTAKAHTGGPQGKVQSLTVESVHLCCGKCVKAVNDAVGKVKGVKGTTAEKNATSFQVTGEFQAKDVFAALEKAGLSGKAGK